MTSAQYAVLCSANTEGLVTWTDRRTLGALVRRGWAREHVGRRGRRLWFITPAGRSALANSPEIVPPRPHWDWQRLATGRYIVEGHEIVRPAQGMLWRVRCPRMPAMPVGYRDYLAEAVDLLADHLVEHKGV